MISWEISKRDAPLYKKVVERAFERGRHVYWGDRQSCEMDILATHANGNPLDFKKMLDAPDIDFFHDVFGIAEHLDRKTGKLKNLFEPRCSKRKASGKVALG